MNLSDNIKRIYQDNGTPISLLNEKLRETGTEFIQIEDPIMSNSSAEDALRSHSIRRGAVAADTEIAIGSLLGFDDCNWFVVDVNALYQYGEIYEYSLLFFQINIVGKIVRLSEQRDTKTYENKIIETVITDPAFGYMGIPVISREESPSGIINTQETLLYMPEIYSMNTGDRFKVSDTEKYQVLMIKGRIVPGLTIAKITEDFRADVQN